MKTLSYALVLLATAAAQITPLANQKPATSVNNTAPADSNAQQARKIIEKCIQAMGGDIFLHYVDSMQKMRGYGFSHGQPGGVGVPYVRYYQFPDKERLEFFKEHDWVIIHKADQGFETTFRGTTKEEPKLLEDFLRRRARSLETVLRGWTQDKSTAFFYEGETISETQQVYQISLINSQGLSVTLFINKATYLPVKKAYQWRDPVDKQKNEEIETFDKYRLVQGIQTPFLYGRTRNGELTAQRFLTEVSYNVNAGDAKFDPPPLHYDKTKK